MPQFAVGVGTLIAAIAAALFAGYAAYAGRAANKISAKVYETDIRPILVPDETKCRAKEDQKVLEIIFSWKNIGKMPARIIDMNPKFRGLKEIIVLPGAIYKSEPIAFSLEQLKTERQIAFASLTYRTGVGESGTTWASEQKGQVIPSLSWPNPDGGIYSGFKLPCPEAHRVSNGRIAADTVEIHLS